MWFDKDCIEKIIYNLLSNAFKHTEPGGRIDVEIEANKVKCCYRIIVSDSGHGIEASEQEQVFESFYQSDHNQKHGTGIGLTLVKRLVELHYGKIELTSKIQEGTSFIITLPIGDSFMKEEEREKDDFEPMLPLENDEKSGEMKKNKKPVLVIAEDNKEMVEYLKRELSEVYNIHVAHNGEEAYDKVKQINPDLVLSDILMPKMNGLELCEKLKGKTAYSQIPVILLTAKSSDQDKLEGIEKGADAYIVKPFKLDFLHAKIKNLIEDRQKMKQFFASHKEVEDFEIDPEREHFLKQAEKVVYDNLHIEDFDSQEFAKKMNLTYSTLYNKLKQYADCSVSGYVRMIRLKEAAKLIANSSMNITEILYEVGFNDAKYFRENFKKFFGVSPSVYLKNYRKKS